jgi:hypothetical protein
MWALVFGFLSRPPPIRVDCHVPVPCTLLLAWRTRNLTCSFTNQMMLLFSLLVLSLSLILVSLLLLPIWCMKAWRETRRQAGLSKARSRKVSANTQRQRQKRKLYRRIHRFHRFLLLHQDYVFLACGGSDCSMCPQDSRIAPGYM